MQYPEDVKRQFSFTAQIDSENDTNIDIDHNFHEIYSSLSTKWFNNHYSSNASFSNIFSFLTFPIKN